MLKYSLTGLTIYPPITEVKQPWWVTVLTVKVAILGKPSVPVASEVLVAPEMVVLWSR